jgi:cold shock CspA family protein
MALQWGRLPMARDPRPRPPAWRVWPIVAALSVCGALAAAHPTDLSVASAVPPPAALGTSVRPSLGRRIPSSAPWLRAHADEYQVAAPSPPRSPATGTIPGGRWHVLAAGSLAGAALALVFSRIADRRSSASPLAMIAYGSESQGLPLSDAASADPPPPTRPFRGSGPRYPAGVTLVSSEVGTTHYKGVIQTWNSKGQFGFIYTPDVPGSNLYVHGKAVGDGGHQTLPPGVLVDFVLRRNALSDGTVRLEAAEVTVVNRLTTAAHFREVCHLLIGHLEGELEWFANDTSETPSASGVLRAKNTTQTVLSRWVLETLASRGQAPAAPGAEGPRRAPWGKGRGKGRGKGQGSGPGEATGRGAPSG